MSDAAPPLRVEVVDGLIVLTGEIDAHTAPILAGHFELAVTQHTLVIDFSGVTFMDSSGVRVVLGEHQQREADGRRLVVHQPSPTVIRLIGLTGLIPFLHVEPPLETP